MLIKLDRTRTLVMRDDYTCIDSFVNCEYGDNIH